MDLLSQMLDGIRIASPLVADIQLGGDASIDMLEGDGEGCPLHYVAEGQVRLTIGGTERELPAGTVVILPKWPRHILHHGKGSTPQSIVEIVERQRLPVWNREEGLDAPLSFEVGAGPFRTRILSGNFLIESRAAYFLTQSLPPALCVGPQDLALSAWIKTSFDLLLNETPRSAAGFSAAAGRALEMIFVQTLRRWLLHEPHHPGLPRGINHSNIRLALMAIHREPGRAWSIRDLAREAGQSRSAFARTFHEAVGETPFSYLRRWRLERAAGQLRDSGLTIAAIASDAGYAAPFAFVRAFTGQFGVNPGTYRRSRAWLPKLFGDDGPIEHGPSSTI